MFLLTFFILIECNLNNSQIQPLLTMPKRSPKLMIKSTKKYWKYLYVVLGVLLVLTGVLLTVFSKIFVNRFIDSVSIELFKNICFFSFVPIIPSSNSQIDKI